MFYSQLTGETEKPHANSCFTFLSVSASLSLSLSLLFLKSNVELAPFKVRLNLQVLQVRREHCERESIDEERIKRSTMNENRKQAKKLKRQHQALVRAEKEREREIKTERWQNFACGPSLLNSFDTLQRTSDKMI